MSVNIAHRGLRNYTPIAPANFNVAAGAAGWVDTDVSASTGTDTTKVWLVTAIAVGFANEAQGVRTNGSAVAAFSTTPLSAQLVQVSSTGHVDLYRNAAAAVNYLFMGYLSGS